MSKIYSRFRFPNLKKLNKFRLTILLILIFLVTVSMLFVIAGYPIFIAKCQTSANGTGIRIINNEINRVMKDYSYGDLIAIEKDNNGNIKLIEAKIVPINEIVSEITSNIQNEINKTPRSKIYIDMSTVTGMVVLKNFGPRINMEMETSGNINTNIISSFESVGINQTLHKISLEINVGISILTPFNIMRKEINAEVLLTEAVIVGEVPSTYLDLK